MEKASIQHGAAHDRKVNKDSSCGCFRIRSIIWSCAKYNKNRTNLGATWPSLFTPSARSQKSRAFALDLSLRAEGVNNYGLVPPRSVLSIYSTYVLENLYVFALDVYGGKGVSKF